MTFREIQIEDVPALFGVRTSTTENAFSLEELQTAGITERSVSIMLQSTHKGWLCEVNQQVVGFSIGNIATGELWVIAVLPEFEGRGIGSKILSLTEQLLWSSGLEELWLVTSVDRSLRAYSFYHSHGWEDGEVTDEGLRMKKQQAEQGAGAKQLKPVAQL